MAIIKPTKPDSELPKTWGGTQYPYTEEQIAEGLPEAIPTVIDGGTLNYEKKGVFERIEYLTNIADVVAGIPIGKILTTDANNKFEYSYSLPDQTANAGKYLTTDGTNPKWAAGGAVPTGTILPYGGSSAPSGFLLCNGAKVSRTTYADLFAKIGTTYGTGDGSTTFALPNYSSARMVTSATVGVNGNGKTLGFTNGTNTFGINSYQQGALRANTPAYGTNVGTTVNSGVIDSPLTVGLTTDSTKSGITGTASLAGACKFIIKY